VVTVIVFNGVTVPSPVTYTPLWVDSTRGRGSGSDLQRVAPAFCGEPAV